MAALPALPATGTDGAPALARGENCLAVCLPMLGAKPCISLQFNADLKAGNAAGPESTERDETAVSPRSNASGGEGGIRTRGRGVYPFNSLANCRFRPLSHLSGADLVGPQGFEPRTNGL